MRVQRSIFKSASGANKFISVLDRMCTKLQSILVILEPHRFMSVTTKFFKGLLNLKMTPPTPK
eukprot:1092582-Pelagomonas_calceolata.AAC.1